MNRRATKVAIILNIKLMIMVIVLGSLVGFFLFSLVVDFGKKPDYYLNHIFNNPENVEKTNNVSLPFGEKIRIYLNKIRDINKDIQDRIYVVNTEIKNLNNNKPQYEKNGAVEIFDTHYSALKQLKTNLEVKGEIVTRLKGEIDYVYQQQQSFKEFKKEIETRSNLINNLIEKDTQITINVENLAVDMACEDIPIQVFTESAYKVLYINDYSALTEFNRKLIEQQHQTEAIIQTIEDLDLKDFKLA